MIERERDGNRYWGYWRVIEAENDTESPTLYMTAPYNR